MYTGTRRTPLTASHAACTGALQPPKQEQTSVSLTAASIHPSPLPSAELPLPPHCGGHLVGDPRLPHRRRGHGPPVAGGSPMRRERQLRRPAGEGPRGAGCQGRRAPVAAAVRGGGSQGLRHRRRPQGRPRALLRPRPHPQPPLPQIEVSLARAQAGCFGAGGFWSWWF